MLRTFAASTLFVLAATAAQAAPAFQIEDVSIKVAYGDLNLAHSEDARILAARLNTAAQDACVQAQNAPTDMKACVSMAVATAVSKIESKMNQDNRVHLAGL